MHSFAVDGLGQLLLLSGRRFLTSPLPGERGNAKADDLDLMANALEMHMFKEEIRLFPMMEQGGNSLIAHLIDDMQAEHLSHADVVTELERRLADLVAPAGTEPEVAALRGALAKLFDDLTQHVHLEEQVPFPMFDVRTAP